MKPLSTSEFRLNPPQSTHPSKPVAIPFKINTYTTASKQMTYIPLEINTYTTQSPQLP
jgi:hypothetical protein